MAKVVEDLVLVKFSRLVRDSATDSDLVSEEICATIEQVVQELVGAGTIVEIVRAQE